MILNVLVFHTLNYDTNRNYCNHITEYSNTANIVKVGKIINFFEIENSVYCVIETYKKNLIENMGSEKVQNEIQRFFITVQDSEEIEIILLKKIIRKCIKIVIDSDIYLTYCVDSEEHD